MVLNEIHKIRKLIYELSPKSPGVQELISQIDTNPEIIQFLGFHDKSNLIEYINDAEYEEFHQLKSEIESYFEEKKKNFLDELPELERTVQYLNREEGIDISVDDIFNAFINSKEIILKKDIWSKLENTESNKIKKGEINKVKDIAKRYNKTDPMIIKKALGRENYKRPLILKFNNRYYLVAGNTRLSTAAALGIEPKVFLANI